MRGRRKQRVSTSSVTALMKEKEASKEAAKEKEAREAGREPARERPRRKGKGKGKEKEMGGGDGKEPAKEKPQGKEKEKEKVMEVSEDGEQNDREKEKEKVRPQFFKVFFPYQSIERLNIPVLFHQHLQEQPTGLVSLKGPSGNEWQLELASESGAWYFQQGWKEFITDHSLKLGSFLVFTYDGPSQFSVAVFSSSGTMDPAALDAKPANAVAVAKTEEEDEGVVEGDMDAGGCSEVSLLPTATEEGNEVTGKRTGAVSGGASEIPLLPTEEGNEVTGKRTRTMSGGTSEMSPLPTEEDHGVTRKRRRATRDRPAVANAPKKQSTRAKKVDKRRPKAGTSKDVSTSKKDPTFSLLDESKTFNKTQIRDKNVPKSGKFLLKTSRAPVVISQRRPITEEEKELALRKATEFKSNYPFTLQIMMESYVYVGFFMNIACEFVREALPQTSKKMTLWDPLGKPWQVNYVYYRDRAVGSFSGGWGKFALGNNLEKFDVCVFELFKEDNIRVHIYRVVPEITPLLRASARD